MLKRDWDEGSIDAVVCRQSNLGSRDGDWEIARVVVVVLREDMVLAVVDRKVVFLLNMVRRGSRPVNSLPLQEVEDIFPDQSWNGRARLLRLRMRAAEGDTQMHCTSYRGHYEKVVM